MPPCHRLGDQSSPLIFSGTLYAACLLSTWGGMCLGRPTTSPAKTPPLVCCFGPQATPSTSAFRHGRRQSPGWAAARRDNSECPQLAGGSIQRETSLSRWNIHESRLHTAHRVHSVRHAFKRADSADVASGNNGASDTRGLLRLAGRPGSKYCTVASGTAVPTLQVGFVYIMQICFERGKARVGIFCRKQPISSNLTSTYLLMETA
ncbi:hypothetical protein DE146DRAFT_732212 [Phaeosphaeria sp. MPI-PUGE-AT-0046c]|nr:hypothetical protein DE146DRAFT_732212 [Phaeosphaeria sp. MPI-PUGE-AT-0046c]